MSAIYAIEQYGILMKEMFRAITQVRIDIMDLKKNIQFGSEYSKLDRMESRLSTLVDRAHSVIDDVLERILTV